MNASTPQYTPIDQPKKSNTRMIIIIVVVVLLCCCCVAVIAGGAYMRSQTNDVFSSINQQLNPTILAPSTGGGALATAEAMATAVAQGTLPVEMPTIPAMNDIPTVAVPANINSAIPQGGLGNEILRADAWGYVITASVAKGCNATDASKTTIEVIQKPASNTSPWAEKWTVVCMDGSKASFDVSFVPDSTGATISVTNSK